MRAREIVIVVIVVLIRRAGRPGADERLIDELRHLPLTRAG